MTTRKEERERMRKERLAAQQAAASSDKRRLYVGYGVAGLLVAAIVAGIIVAIAGGSDDPTQVDGGDVPPEAHVQIASGSVNDVPFDSREGTPPPAVEEGQLEPAARAAGCELNLDLEDEGRDHIQPNRPTPDYQTNPATSGDHVIPPRQQADGAYSEKPDEKFTVHALEHGRVEIQYSPDLPEEDQLALKGVFDDSPEGMLLFPNPDMPFDVAATAWTQMIGCKRYEGAATLDAIRAFRDTFRDRGPERVPIYVPDP